jgi:integral membrane protein (TIGR01906 family)
MPIFLILLGIRLVLNPAYPYLAYNTPALVTTPLGLEGFPEDIYGFTAQERIKWATVAIDYLLNDAGIEFLGDLKFDDGSPLYNDRELGHMLDVKIVVQQVLRVFYLAAAALSLLGVWAWFGKWWTKYLSGMSRGGWLTAMLIFGFALLASISFWQFFTAFHQIFFEGDSWLFNYSDTLIRLFPIKFWQDVCIYIFGFALVSGVLIGLLVKPRGR